jgi:hypothetical protein
LPFLCMRSPKADLKISKNLKKQGKMAPTSLARGLLTHGTLRARGGGGGGGGRT